MDYLIFQDVQLRTDGLPFTDQRYPLPEDRSRYQDRIAGADRGDGGVLPCEPGLSAAGRDRIQQQGEERYPGGY